jgi:hypothetical protein
MLRRTSRREALVLTQMVVGPPTCFAAHRSPRPSRPKRLRAFMCV